jgi:hypothetical protein
MGANSEGKAGPVVASDQDNVITADKSSPLGRQGHRKLIWRMGAYRFNRVLEAVPIALARVGSWSAGPEIECVNNKLGYEPTRETTER